MKQQSFVDKLGEENRRLLLGLGIPLVGGFLLPILARHGIDLGPTEWLIVGEMMLLAGVGAFLCARWWAIIVVPLALVAGLMTAFILEGQDLVWLWHISGFKKLMTLVIDGALAGAILGVAVAKGVQMAEHFMVGRTPLPPMLASSPAPVQNPLPVPHEPEKQAAKVEAELQNIPPIPETAQPVSLPRTLASEPEQQRQNNPTRDEVLVSMLAQSVTPAGEPLDQIARQFASGLSSSEKLQLEAYWKRNEHEQRADPIEQGKAPAVEPLSPQEAKTPEEPPFQQERRAQEDVLQLTPEEKELLEHYRKQKQRMSQASPPQENLVAQNQAKEKPVAQEQAPSILSDIQQELGIPPPYQRKGKGR